jgi:hypothetical protein
VLAKKFRGEKNFHILIDQVDDPCSLSNSFLVTASVNLWLALSCQLLEFLLVRTFECLAVNDE